MCYTYETDLQQAAVEKSGFGPDTGVMYAVTMVYFTASTCNKWFSYLILSYLILSYLMAQA